MTQNSFPREGSVVVAGYPWMARMIDKARLEATGQIGQYDLDYPCPMDQRLLAQLGIDGKSFQAIVIDKQTDDAIVEELKARNLIQV